MECQHFGGERILNSSSPEHHLGAMRGHDDHHEGDDGEEQGAEKIGAGFLFMCAVL